MDAEQNSEFPIADFSKRSTDDASRHIIQLRTELVLRSAEVTGVDAMADVVLFKASLHAAGKRLLNEEIEEEDDIPQHDLEVICERLPSEDKNNFAACLKLLTQIESRMSSSPQSGDRPKVPTRTRRSSNASSNSEPIREETPQCDMFQIPYARRMQMLAVCLANFFTGLPLFLAVYISMYFIPLLWPVVWIYNIWMVYDIFIRKAGSIPRPPSKKYRNLGYWKLYRDYFPIRLRVEDSSKFVKVNEDGEPQTYLFTLHPHGIHSFGAFVNFATNATGVDDLLPNIKMYVQTLGIQFKLPLWRELVSMGGCGDASKECLTRVLSGNAGNAALLVVGGAEEALDASPGTFDLVLKKRKGFVKIALLTGTNLVPTFSFGENDVYNNLVREHPGSRRFMKVVQRILGFSVPLIQGRGIFNYRWGLLPHRRPITTVVGQPIPIKKWEGSTTTPEFSKRIDEVHQQYTEALCELYDRHKNIHALARCDTLRFTR
eukprot:TRINITY_DN16854_c0_g1_i3.p1 TRINITY_DN16854_c0_g1~~TRINITY_DN16854_c0_g1_i3.p1  ORF type:complete len:503 (+),score=81.76 TRINITY_DN16854_c0_g1_i3:45-1511(+)